MRALVFLCFAMSFLAPLIFVSINYNPETSLPPDFGHLAVVGSIYALGLFFYLSRIPERFLKNGKVDYVGSSH